MNVRSKPHAVAVPLAARSTPRIDYLKLTVWLGGALIPWLAIALYLGH
jgi:hypothetical protein